MLAKQISGTAFSKPQLNYIENVFSTYLYTGNGSNQTIINGIDLLNEGGLVWIKSRSNAFTHIIADTARGAGGNNALSTSSTAAAFISPVDSFASNGFQVDLDGGGAANGSGLSIVSWTFRKAPKFFDVVAFTWDPTVTRDISHSLQSIPGTVIIKRTNSADPWWIVHRSVASFFNFSTSAAQGGTVFVNGIGPSKTNSWVGATTTTFDPSNFCSGIGTNTYVAYLFAHDAGGFGLNGTDNVISCGSFTVDGSGNASVNLGYEPQWILYKKANTTGQWYLEDIMRGLSAPTGIGATLIANLNNAESAGNGNININATGFTVINGQNLSASDNVIYIAIRRGPMETPTVGTDVFQPTVYTGTNVDNRLVNTTIAPDTVWVRQRNSTTVWGMVVGDRLRGQPYLLTGDAPAEVTAIDAFDQEIVSTIEYGNAFSAMNGFWCGNNTTASLNANTTSNNHIVEAFRRAPGFMDVVCYTGTGANRTVSHNLGVAPELIIVKRRSAFDAWWVYDAATGNTKYNVLNTTATPVTSSTAWNNTSPTSSVFTVGTGTPVNASSATYVAYLFATCAGVSKVGSYTGTGNPLSINCGFTNGARLVLIKRTDSTGDWYIWDSARGIVEGNDPYLRLSSRNAEDASADDVDTISSGFIVNANKSALNANGGTYIFLAIA